MGIGNEDRVKMEERVSRHRNFENSVTSRQLKK